MLSNSGNTAIVFNGEIYNYLSIKNMRDISQCYLIAVILLLCLMEKYI
ncbi:hypothetical protein IBE71_10070, partial [Francisella tularensis]|nr:hypothetical protein [Francisella tularensis]